jgi:hypothetical protein
MNPVSIDRLGSDDWQTLRNLRLAALQESQHAFWSSYSTNAGVGDGRGSPRPVAPSVKSPIDLQRTEPKSLNPTDMDRVEERTRLSAGAFYPVQVCQVPLSHHRGRDVPVGQTEAAGSAALDLLSFSAPAANSFILHERDPTLGRGLRDPGGVLHLSSCGMP